MQDFNIEPINQRNLISALNTWKFVRSNTIEFIKALGNDALKYGLPRQGLDNCCKHFQEMLSIQDAYIQAIETGYMDFDVVGSHDSFDGEDSVENLLIKMEGLDTKLETIVFANTVNLIDWEEPTKKTLISHLGHLIIHEAFHLGQLAAFCCNSDITLPKVTEAMWLIPKKTA